MGDRLMPIHGAGQCQQKAPSFLREGNQLGKGGENQKTQVKQTSSKNPSYTKRDSLDGLTGLFILYQLNAGKGKF